MSFDRVDGSCLDNFFLEAIPFVDNMFREEMLSYVSAASVFLNFSCVTSGSIVHVKLEKVSNGTGMVCKLSITYGM